METHIVIMAGGIGSRFWPMSTPECPKQFIDVTGCGKSLIQLTVERFQGLCIPDNIWIVTSDKYKETVRKQLPSVPPHHILTEPVARNTAPCITYACWKIKKHHPHVSVSAILSCRPFFILIFLPYIKMRHYGFSRKSIWKNLETFP